MSDAAPEIRLTESAGKRIAELRAMEGNPALMLRITVSGGGCAGFQYGFALDDKKGAEDVIFDAEGVQVVVDEMSLGLLAGSELDYVEDLMGAYFTLRNPNATSTCGCGSSFSV